MRALASGHRTTELPAHFPCAACGNTIERAQGDTIATGYAVRTSDNEMICYACAHKDELQHAKDTGRLFAYVSGIGYRKDGNRYYGTPRLHNKPPAERSIATWPGLALNAPGTVHALSVWQSNFGDIRIAIRAKLPTGPQGTLETWHGTYYASAGDYCRMRRSKQHTTTSNGKECTRA